MTELPRESRVAVASAKTRFGARRLRAHLVNLTHSGHCRTALDDDVLRALFEIPPKPTFTIERRSVMRWVITAPRKEANHAE